MPGRNPGRLMENRVKANRMRNTNGIIKDTILSIPMFTPRLAITPVTSTEIIKKITG